MVAESHSISPWWEDRWVAQLLHRAIADGATVTNCAEYWGDDIDDPDSDEWLLNIEFAVPRPSRATVRFTSDHGHWVLLANTEPLSDHLGGEVDQQMASAYAVSLAAKLCRDLNTILLRSQRRPGSTGALSEELEALLGDRGITPAEFAAELGVTHAVMSSKMKGTTAWSATDLLRAARILDLDGGVNALHHLLDAVDADVQSRQLVGHR